jgi:histidinol-phosphate aminotransferase
VIAIVIAPVDEVRSIPRDRSAVGYDSPVLPCLRPDLPSPGSFTVNESPHRAKLDQNEAPFDLPDEVKQEIAAALAARAWNRYPQPAEYARARAKVAGALQLDPERIALTVGADQVIQGAFLLAGGPGRRARWFEPTYPYIALASRATGTIGEGIVLGEEIDTLIDPQQVLAAPAPHLLVFVSPNNPTGGLPQRRAIEAALADDGRLVLVDEAYHDFSGDTVLDDLGHRPNLLIARSLSKSLLAGARLGFAIGHPDTIAAFDRLYTAPYHLNALQLLVAERYGELLRHIRSSSDRVTRECEWLYAALTRLPGVTPRPSQGNFVLFRVEGHAIAVHARLADAGVRIRNVSGLPGLSEHLRVTAGTREENELFITELQRALAELTMVSPPG